MNCEAYISVYRGNECKLYPYNINPDIISHLCIATEEAASNSYPDETTTPHKYLVIKREDNIVYYAYIVEPDDKPNEKILIMTSLNGVVIDDIFALEAFMRWRLIDIGHESKTLLFDETNGRFKTALWDERALFENQSSLRTKFNEAFAKKGYNLNALDYTRTPGLDTILLNVDSTWHRTNLGNHLSGLSIRQSIEAGNTVIVALIEPHIPSEKTAGQIQPIKGKDDVKPQPEAGDNHTNESGKSSTGNNTHIGKEPASDTITIIAIVVAVIGFISMFFILTIHNI